MRLAFSLSIAVGRRVGHRMRTLTVGMAGGFQVSSPDTKCGRMRKNSQDFSHGTLLEKSMGENSAYVRKSQTEVCQCDICRSQDAQDVAQTSNDRPSQTNKTLSLPEAETTRQEPPETLNHPIISPTSPKVSSIREEIDDFTKPNVTHERNSIKEL